MCGIAGFSRPQSRSSIPNGRKFGVVLAETIESRGKDATGFGWFEKDDRTNVWYHKNRGKSTDIAKDAPLPRRGISVLTCHTRHLTLGTSYNNDNNHPVIQDGIVACHNGRVSNHTTLIGLTKLKRVGQVDSWAVPALLASAAELGGTPTQLLELIEGVAAISWLDSTQHDVLHLARLSTRPLTVGWTRKGDLVYSSTRATLADAAKKGGIHVTDVIDIPEGTYLKVQYGEILEWTDFKVNHPPVKVKDDKPGGKQAKRPWAKAQQIGTSKGTKPGKQVELPLSGVVSYEPERYVPQYSGEGDLTGFDAWEDEIDWDNLVPRRGWKDSDLEWEDDMQYHSQMPEPEDDLLFDHINAD